MKERGACDLGTSVREALASQGVQGEIMGFGRFSLFSLYRSDYHLCFGTFCFPFVIGNKGQLKNGIEEW